MPGDPVEIDLRVAITGLPASIDTAAPTGLRAPPAEIDRLEFLENRLADLERNVTTLFDRSETIRQVASDHEKRLASIQQSLDRLWRSFTETLGGNTRRRSQRTGIGW